MPHPHPLTWLLALLLCWQGMAVAVASPMLASGSELRSEHHAGMTSADCAQHPEHCQRDDNSGPHHCGQQCLHCPASTAVQPAMILPELTPQPAAPLAAIAARAPPRPGVEIYRPPMI